MKIVSDHELYKLQILAKRLVDAFKSMSEIVGKEGVQIIKRLNEKK